jgi:hypothetical protein
VKELVEAREVKERSANGLVESSPWPFFVPNGESFEC